MQIAQVGQGLSMFDAMCMGYHLSVIGWFYMFSAPNHLYDYNLKLHELLNFDPCPSQIVSVLVMPVSPFPAKQTHSHEQQYVRSLQGAPYDQNSYMVDGTNPNFANLKMSILFLVRSTIMDGDDFEHLIKPI